MQTTEISTSSDSTQPNDISNDEPFFLNPARKIGKVDDINFDKLKWKFDEKQLLNQDLLNKQRDNFINILTQTLVSAVVTNNKKALIHAINSDVPLNLELSDSGMTALTAAAHFNKMSIVQVLLGYGCNPAYCPKNVYRYNAFHAACRAGNLDIVRFLLTNPTLELSTNHLSEKNIKGRITVDMPEPVYGQSGLQLALLGLKIDCAKVLIDEYHANTSHVDYHGRTPLATAIGILFTEQANMELDSLNPKITAQQKAARIDNLKNLEGIILLLLGKENAFHPSMLNAKPAAQVIINPILADHVYSNSVDDDNEEIDITRRPSMKADYALKVFIIYMPKAAKEIYEQALPMRGSPFTSDYISIYEEIMKKKPHIQMLQTMARR